MRRVEPRRHVEPDALGADRLGELGTQLVAPHLQPIRLEHARARARECGVLAPREAVSDDGDAGVAECRADRGDNAAAT